MTYSLGGLGDTNYGSVVPSFCSATHPMAGCSPISGVAKPMDVATLDLFKELQRQLNRVAQLKGLSKIDVDGRIGPGTVKLYRLAFNQPSSITCDTVALVASSVVQSAKALADQGSVPTTVPGPIVPISPPSTPNTDGTVSDPPGVGAFGAIQGLATMLPGGNLGALAAIGLISYGVYRISKKPKRGGSAVKSQRTRGRRRRGRVRARARARVRRIRRRRR
jgi:hypothetical protein